MNEVKLFVRGMNCNHCKMRVEDQLKKIEGIEKVSADLDRQVVTITGDELDLNQVKKLVEDIGYRYDGEVK
jgi:copper chaperone CopZ